MISVIVPVYNIENYIEKCIKSILEQSYTEIELLLVDDGSEDKSSHICKEYAAKDPRVLYFRRDNQGQGIARTYGLEKAKGKYVTFVDGDDWLEPDAIKYMMLAAEDKNADIVVGDIYYVYQDGDIYKKKYSKVRYEDGQLIEKNMSIDKINKLRTFTCGKLYEKQFLLENNFSQGAYAYEDVATVPLLVAKAERITYINRPVYNYLKNRLSSTIHNNEKVKDMYLSLNELFKGFIKMDDYLLYETELQRMIWGQIRFIYKINNISWSDITDKEFREYKSFILLIKKMFPGFVCPDECDIEVVNSKYGKKILGEILISLDKVRYVTDIRDATSRIIVHNTDKKTYVINDNYLNDDATEEYIWNCVDEFFAIAWGK